MQVVLVIAAFAFGFARASSPITLLYREESGEEKRMSTTMERIALVLEGEANLLALTSQQQGFKACKSKERDLTDLLSQEEASFFFDALSGHHSPKAAISVVEASLQDKMMTLQPLMRPFFANFYSLRVRPVVSFESHRGGVIKWTTLPQLSLRYTNTVLDFFMRRVSESIVSDMKSIHDKPVLHHASVDFRDYTSVDLRADFTFLGSAEETVRVNFRYKHHGYRVLFVVDVKRSSSSPLTFEAQNFETVTYFICPGVDVPMHSEMMGILSRHLLVWILEETEFKNSVTVTEAGSTSLNVGRSVHRRMLKFSSSQDVRSDETSATQRGQSDRSTSKSPKRRRTD